MKREIKFRAWDETAKTMLHVLSVDNRYVWIEDDKVCGSYGCWYQRGQASGDGWWVYVEPENLMQYTGLKDKNEKEIYEGDICKCYETVGSKKDKKVKTWIAEVCFKCGIFCLVNRNCCDICRDGFGMITPVSEVGCPCEIIGDIHNNPKLLK